MRLFLFVLLNSLTFTGLFSQNSLIGTTIKDHGYDQALKSTLVNYHVFEMDVQKSSLNFESSQSMFFSTGIKDFNLSVFPNNLAVSYKDSNLPHLIGGHSETGDVINFTIADNFIFGYIRKGNSRLFIEPVWYFDKSAPRNLFVAYYDFDVIFTAEHKCGVETTGIKTQELDPSRMTTDECVIVEYAIANTFDMVTEFGTVAEVETFNLAVLNTVQSNYRSEFDSNIEYEVVANFIPASSGADPFSSSNDSEVLLNGITNWGDGGGNSGGASGGFGVDYHMAGLWTDRNISFNGGFGTVGLAWTPGWHHVLENFSSNSLQLQVMVSHEIGHNWSAVHDGGGSGFIMAPSVNGTTTWSSASVNSINNRVAAQNSFLDDCSTMGAPNANFFQSTIITCVGSEVEFEDQSQYGATRVWDFDNGTPSSSVEEKESVTYNTMGQHHVKVTSSNSAGSDDYIYYVDVQNAPPATCNPSGSGGVGGIVNVSLENVSNPSDDAGAAGRYEDFACEHILRLETDTDYDIIVGTQGSSNTSVRIYIDNNGNGSFSAAELEANFNLNSGGANYSLPFTTAASPVEDEVLRFRIIHDIGISGPCENPSYSQVEDYGVVFSSGVEPVLGCTDPAASNYDPTATVDDGTCDVTTMTWYRDFDDDDFGDANTTVVASTAPPGYISNDEDCDDTDDSVFPGAPEICDGQRNNCNQSGIPSDEVDNDGDGRVECAYSASTWKGPTSVIGGNDCDDSDSTIYPGAPEICDGQRNNCNQSGIPSDEVDNDSDGHVECVYSAATWKGPASVIGGNDCDDSDNTVYPGAPEVCDGQRNDCNQSGIPTDEVDNDSDGYVECSYNASTWVGDSNVVGGGDCDDSNNQRYPGNTETCDSLDNDCDGIIDEGCQPCDGVDIIINMVTQNTTSAEETIVSTTTVDEPSPIQFFAGNSIEFGNNFEVLASTNFLAAIEGCGMTTFSSGGVVNFSNPEEVKDMLLVLIDQMNEELDASKEKTLTIMDLNQKVIFNDSLALLLKKSNDEISQWFLNDRVFIALLSDGDQNAIGKFVHLK